VEANAIQHFDENICELRWKNRENDLQKIVNMRFSKWC